MSESIRMKWMTITCFEMDFNGTHIVSDPCIGANPTNDLTWEDIEDCSLMTLSHVHWDHITDIPALWNKFKTPVLVPPISAPIFAKWADLIPAFIYPMEQNLELDFGFAKVKALFGRHCSPDITSSELLSHFLKNPICAEDPVMLEMQHYGDLEYRNYLFTTPAGTKILLWGNDPTYQQRMLMAQQKPDIAILQLSKQDPIEIAEFAAAIGAKTLIPHHMDLKKTPDVYMEKVRKCEEHFLKLVPDGRFITPKNNEWFTLV